MLLQKPTINVVRLDGVAVLNAFVSCDLLEIINKHEIADLLASQFAKLLLFSDLSIENDFAFIPWHCSPKWFSGVFWYKELVLYWTAMKRRLSNPYRVILSGVLDIVFYMLIVFAIALILSESSSRIELGEHVYLVKNLVLIGVTYAYVLLLLPILDHNGGSVGKRILGLRCINHDHSRPASFATYFQKTLLIGTPVFFVFAMTFRLVGMSINQVVMAIRIGDIVFVLVLLIQAISLFIGKRSLFEKISRSSVVSKKYFVQQSLSFEFLDTDAMASEKTLPGRS